MEQQRGMTWTGYNNLVYAIVKQAAEDLELGYYTVLTLAPQYEKLQTNKEGLVERIEIANNKGRDTSKLKKEYNTVYNKICKYNRALNLVSSSLNFFYSQDFTAFMDLNGKELADRIIKQATQQTQTGKYKRHFHKQME